MMDRLSRLLRDLKITGRGMALILGVLLAVTFVWFAAGVITLIVHSGKP